MEMKHTNVFGSRLVSVCIERMSSINDVIAPDQTKQIQSNLSLRTPLYYGQFVWSQERQKSYILYLYNTDTSVKRTLGFVPLVSLLKRFDCTHFKAKRSNCKHVSGAVRIECNLVLLSKASLQATPVKLQDKGR